MTSVTGQDIFCRALRWACRFRFHAKGFATLTALLGGSMLLVRTVAQEFFSQAFPAWAFSSIPFNSSLDLEAARRDTGIIPLSKPVDRDQLIRIILEMCSKNKPSGTECA